MLLYSFLGKFSSTGLGTVFSDGHLLKNGQWALKYPKFPVHEQSTEESESVTMR